MAIQLNHTIAHTHDKATTAPQLAQLLGLPEPRPFGPFLVLDLGNDVSLDFIDSPPEDDVWMEHYAFLVAEDEFDAIWARLQARGLEFYADPACSQPGEINHHYGGRGLYWLDPSGHLLEIITQPYGPELP